MYKWSRGHIDTSGTTLIVTIKDSCFDVAVISMPFTDIGTSFIESTAIAIAYKQQHLHVERNLVTALLAWDRARVWLVPDTFYRISEFIKQQQFSKLYDDGMIKAYSYQQFNIKL